MNIEIDIKPGAKFETKKGTITFIRAYFIMGDHEKKVEYRINNDYTTSATLEKFRGIISEKL